MGIGGNMSRRIIFGLVLLLLSAGAATATADSQCLSQASNGELLREIERRLTGGPTGVELSMKCQCGNDDAADTYEIWVSGTGSSEELRKKAQSMCKWGTFKDCRYAQPVGFGTQILECQCGQDGASDTYTVSGAGKTLGDAYADAVATCKWKPIVKKCRAPTP